MLFNGCAILDPHMRKCWQVYNAEADLRSVPEWEVVARSTSKTNWLNLARF